MIKLWVLIIVIGSDGTARSPAVVQQEFNTLESCQAAMKSIAGQVEDRFLNFEVKSSGCYQK